MIRELIKTNRTYRRFYEEVKIDRGTLEELIDLARLSSSGANLQPLKYIISYTDDKNNIIFPHLRWAGYLKDWDGPVVGERPAAYILMLLDKNISKSPMWDHGIACQSILLGAAEKGLGGCMFGSIDRAGLMNALNIPEDYELLLTIALGKPKEEVVLEEIKDPKEIKYWRNEKGVHHVPKRKLQDLILD
ncbi:MAG: nitroreductase family protein [Bacillota bacterium]|nr:nitroreductase family protein [Bacillota bacterium]